MNPKFTAPRIFFPRTIGEALDLAGNEPEAVFCGGGTYLTRDSMKRSILDLPRVLISLGQIEELARASRSEHHLELGAMMSLDRMGAIGRSALPAGLHEALFSIGNKPLRCRATIGGHLAMKERVGDLKPLLQLLETRIEIRYLRERSQRRKPTAAIRRIASVQLDEGAGLSRGELITRISIPIENWNRALYCKVHPYTDPSRVLVFAALARIEKGTLAEWRMAFSDGICNPVRDRDIEVDLAGRVLPLGEREQAALDVSVDRMTASWSDRSCERTTIRRLARGFLDIETE